MDNPLVSIIMPSYNSAATIGETINSIQRQTYRNWELLVTDDCSVDSTKSIIETLCLKDERIKFYENKKNSGAAISRNNSLRVACGEFIAFLDSDDLWEETKLEDQLSWMLENEHISFSFTAYQLINENGDNLNKVVDLQGHGKSFTYQDMLFKKATLGCSTVILRKNAFKEIQMPLIRTGQDYALWLKLLKTGTKAYLYNKVLTKYRILPGSISRNKFKKTKRQWQIYRELERLPFWYAVVCFISYGWRAVNRR